MKIACAFIALCAAALPLHAQQADPLKSPACGAALADLQAARQGGGDVNALRSAAASACLGSSALPTRPSRVLQAPVVVPPPQTELPPRVAPLPAPVLPPPPVVVERAPLPATCDAGGCWSQGDGTHLRHVPPALVVPGVACTQQGTVVYCR